MDRRELLQMLALAGVVGAAGRSTGVAAHPDVDLNADRPKIVMLAYPDMVLLDLVPAQTVFALTMADIQIVWKNRDPVKTDLGMSVQPTTVFNEAFDAPDVLFVPGGLRGTVACMDDPEVRAFVKATGDRARFVTSVCTGSLLLASAGLLQGYRATGHWHSRHALSRLGVELADERVVIDRNRITGGGVTAGLDFGLRVAALLRGEEWAKTIQLVLEYAPAPPFEAGTVAGAGPAVTKIVTDMLTPGLAPLDRSVAHAQVRLKG